MPKGKYVRKNKNKKRTMPVKGEEKKPRGQKKTKRNKRSLLNDVSGSVSIPESEMIITREEKSSDFVISDSFGITGSVEDGVLTIKRNGEQMYTESDIKRVFAAPPKRKKSMI